MWNVIRLSNSIAVLFSLVATFIAIKVTGLVSPILTGGSKEELGVLLSLPLMATPVIYKFSTKLIDDQLEKRRKAAEEKAASAPEPVAVPPPPPRTVTPEEEKSVSGALMVAAILVIIAQIVGFAVGFCGAFVLAMIDPQSISDISTEAGYMAFMFKMAPIMYALAAIGAWLGGSWLAKRHGTIARKAVWVAALAYWVMGTLVNYVISMQPGFSPYSPDEINIFMRVGSFIGMAIGGLLPAAWVALFIWLGGRMTRKRLDIKAQALSSGDGI